MTTLRSKKVTTKKASTKAAKPKKARPAKATTKKKPTKKPSPPKKAKRSARRSWEWVHLKQVVPGWYYVLQQQPVGTGAPKEVGRLHVTSRTGGATRETWYLYTQSSESGGGPSGTSPRYIFESPGSPDRRNDELYLNQSSTPLSQPTGITSNKIVADCAAPVSVGP